MRGGHLALPLLALALLGCSGVSKLDYTSLHNRAGWQRPDRLVEALGIRPGDSVADIGAGEGYFLPYLSEAVGPTGTLYVVEVEDDITRALTERVARDGYSNVVVVRGDYDDPQLPEGAIDLVFLCNTYHHIEERPAYFAALRSDLRGVGRIAIVDPNDDLRGILSLFLDAGHTTSVDAVVGEMQTAGYRPSESHDFLPTQIFEVFSPAPDEDR